MSSSLLSTTNIIMCLLLGPPLLLAGVAVAFATVCGLGFLWPISLPLYVLFFCTKVGWCHLHTCVEVLDGTHPWASTQLLMSTPRRYQYNNCLRCTGSLPVGHLHIVSATLVPEPCSAATEKHAHRRCSSTPAHTAGEKQEQTT